MMRLDLPARIDRHLKPHGLPQGLSWGWIAAIWLAHLLTESDHRKLPVQDWVRQAGETITRLTGLPVRELDSTDDRLTLLLRVYALKAQIVRLDPTTVSGYHVGGEASRFEFGHSKDDPTLRQVKVMMAAVDPLGLPLITQVVAGNCADDPLYLSAIERVLQIIPDTVVLFVGDSKMSALETRTYLQRQPQHYLCPLALTGKTAQDLRQWIDAANVGAVVLQPIYLDPERTPRQPVAEGYVLERIVSAAVTPNQPALPEWTEQVFGAFGTVSPAKATGFGRTPVTRLRQVAGADAAPGAWQAPNPDGSAIDGSGGRHPQGARRGRFAALYF